MSVNLSVYGKTPHLFGVMGGNLPAFLHVFAFSLITAGVMKKSRPVHGRICLFWFCVNSLFELGQKYPDVINSALPQGLSHHSLMGRTADFFNKGTFDSLDILAFATGALAAYALLTMMEKKE